jgi:hypothetical protein
MQIAQMLLDGVISPGKKEERNLRSFEKLAKFD